MRPFDESELPETKPASVQEATTDGLMLAEYANRMKVKNAIIVRVLTRDEAYDPIRYVDAATDAIGTLAEEFDGEAQRLADRLSTIESRGGEAVRAHDYRRRDSHNVRHHKAVLQALVTELRAHCDDRGYLLDLIENARTDAWADISRAVEDSLDRARIVVDETYRRERKKRIRLLISEDLATLVAPAARSGLRPRS